MQQWPSHEHEKKSEDLEQRLAAYYGPRLREQPLSHDSWQRLSRKLGQSRRSRLRLRWPIKHIMRRRFRMFMSPPTPEYIQTAFNRVIYASHTSYMSSVLYCTFKRKLRAPTVRVSTLRKQHIRLKLPVDAERSIGTAGLDVLLASGLARYQMMKKALLIRLLLTSFICIGVCATIFYWVHNQAWMGILIVTLGGLGLLLLLDRQKRGMCHAADTLVVLWIGRDRMCEGLHMLAQRTRSPYRRRWGEPSVAERIKRTCGTRVESRDERLTMIR